MENGFIKNLTSYLKSTKEKCCYHQKHSRKKQVSKDLMIIYLMQIERVLIFIGFKTRILQVFKNVTKW